MQKNKKKEKATIVSNEAVHGKPHLDIDRTINIGALDNHVHRKDKL
ncbi:hypothetical protein J2Z83_002367 [Virgibacillus natechei]|uniref:Uncharacterized protein n=1 Tax=Virgibacillus natechei TaxID=1216297 RepID=A0ABS4IH29_9BACI|nr:hypothetical protein [Virgibacillus natechei]MBP1970249.1 hypothetical protein [Virgibacillus natechei]UZD12805.1 hypothetical protein OLD84_18270 [Virgibacillus natechei]